MWLLASLACAPAGHPPPTPCDLPVDPSAPDVASAAAWAQERVDRGVPGLLVSIDRPGAEAAHAAAGSSDLDAGAPLGTCQLTRAGSVNKVVNAVVVLQLAHEGALGLDQPLRELLPADTLRGLPNADRATVRQALRHSTGIPDWIDSLGFQTASLDDLERDWAADELLTFARHMPAAFEPDADVGYSNTNALLLGLAVERLTGRRLADVYAERVFEPLGLAATRFAAPDPTPPELVRGYVDLRNDGHVVDATTYNGWDVHADGGLLSNPAELTTLLRAAVDGTLVPEPERTAMLEVRRPRSPDPAFYPVAHGLGVFRADTPTGRWWFHSGDAVGYWATALVRESDGVAVSWAANGNYGGLDAPVSSRAAFDEVLALVDPPDGRR